jgi:cytochrome c biogenesis protein CcdA
MTRAVISLLHLQLHQAFRYNPLVFTLAPIYTIYWYAVKQGHLPASKVTMAFMLAITITFGILRNLPAWDFLAPTIID